MNAFEFFSRLNNYAPFLQSAACKKANNDMEEARNLYLETVHRAMKAKGNYKSNTDFKQWITSIMANIGPKG